MVELPDGVREVARHTTEAGIQYLLRSDGRIMWRFPHERWQTMSERGSYAHAKEFWDTRIVGRRD